MKMIAAYREVTPAFLLLNAVPMFAQQARNPRIAGSLLPFLPRYRGALAYVGGGSAIIELARKFRVPNPPLLHLNGEAGNGRLVFAVFCASRSEMLDAANRSA